MYVEFNAQLKDVSLKNGAVKLEANLPKGAADILADMIGRNVEVTLEIKQVAFRVKHHAKTNEPMVRYKVESTGIVSEVKPPEGEQTEMDLNVPKQPEPTVEKEQDIDRDIIDQFIAEGLSPTYEDLTIDFHALIKRRTNGESYHAMAREFKMSPDVMVEMLTEYRKRVAPLAQKWHEWKTGQIEAVENTVQAPERAADASNDGAEGKTTSEDTEALESNATSEEGKEEANAEAVSEEEPENGDNQGTDDF